MPMTTTPLTTDETAILLLCATLGRGADCPRPLTAMGYDRLAGWLRARGARPGDLLHEPSELLNELEKSELGDLALAARHLVSGRLAALLKFEAWSRVGGWILTRASVDYPRTLSRLGPKRPPVLFGVGARNLLGKKSIAVVGSRDAPPDDLEFSRDLGVAAARSAYAIVSGAARGIDTAAMTGALAAEGTALGIVSERLAEIPASPSWRKSLLAGNLCMVSAVDPESRFTTGNAMARNKIIYGLAEHAIVVRASNGSGGTWAGATEAIRGRWCPIHARQHPPGDAQDAAKQLAKLGAGTLPASSAASCLAEVLSERQPDGNAGPPATLWE